MSSWSLQIKKEDPEDGDIKKEDLKDEYIKKEDPEDEDIKEEDLPVDMSQYEHWVSTSHAADTQGLDHKGKVGEVKGKDQHDSQDQTQLAHFKWTYDPVVHERYNIMKWHRPGLYYRWTQVNQNQWVNLFKKNLHSAFNEANSMCPPAAGQVLTRPFHTIQNSQDPPTTRLQISWEEFKESMEHPINIWSRAIELETQPPPAGTTCALKLKLLKVEIENKSVLTFSVQPSVELPGRHSKELDLHCLQFHLNWLGGTFATATDDGIRAFQTQLEQSGITRNEVYRYIHPDLSSALKVGSDALPPGLQSITSSTLCDLHVSIALQKCASSSQSLWAQVTYEGSSWDNEFKLWKPITVTEDNKHLPWPPGSGKASFPVELGWTLKWSGNLVEKLSKLALNGAPIAGSQS